MPTPATATETGPIRPDLWLLDPTVVHLNHGSYGAVPIPVLAAQREASEAVEKSPEQFYRTGLGRQMSSVRNEVAEFLRTDAAGLVLVQNATEAAQVVLTSLQLEPQAEILFTDHAYPWVKTAIARLCAERGAVPREIALPDATGLTDGEFAQALVTSLRHALTERTALVVLDQITSGSALRLPVEAVCAELGDQVPILIDGAHAPGLIDAPVPGKAAFWFGNLHKWAFAARTAAALVVAPAWRGRVRPLVSSYGEELGYPDSFNYLGTQDASAYLALPAALGFPQTHLGLTYAQLRQRNSAVLDLGAEQVARALGGAVPRANGLPLRTVPLGVSGDGGEAWELTGRLRSRGVEVAVTSLSGRLHLRLSVQAYVGVADFELLVAALQCEGLTH